MRRVRSGGRWRWFSLVVRGGKGREGEREEGKVMKGVPFCVGEVEIHPLSLRCYPDIANEAERIFDGG